MKKIILAIIINLLCFLNYGNAKVKSENITFPKHFYTDQIEVCFAAGNERFKSSYTKSKIEKISKDRMTINHRFFDEKFNK